MFSRAVLLNQDGVVFRQATLEEFQRGMRNPGRKVSIEGIIYFLRIPSITFYSVKET
jgi:hypothetical protein